MTKGTVRQNELETGRAVLHPRRMTKHSPFRYFETSPEIIRLAVMLYVRFSALTFVMLKIFYTNAVLVLALPYLPLSPNITCAYVALVYSELLF
jgi:hypothetical protein